MPTVKLTYFNLRARAETARLLLAYAGVSYEDERVVVPWEDPAAWSARKATTPWGQLPSLAWDGEVIYTSLAISRFLAREFGLMGKNSIQSAQVDEVMDVIQDVIEAGVMCGSKKDETEKKMALAHHKTDTIPDMLKKMEKRLVERGGQFMVGNCLTLADIQLFNFCTDNPTCCENQPNLTDLVRRVGELPNIKKWVENRPITAF